MATYEEQIRARDLARMQRVGMTPEQQQAELSRLEQTRATTEAARQAALREQGLVPKVTQPYMPQAAPETVPQLPIRPEPMTRAEPTVATPERAVITRPGTVPTGAVDREKALEDIAVKRAMGQPLTEQDLRTEFQAARGMQTMQFEDIVTPEDYLQLNPEQQMQYRQAAFMQQAGMQKEAMKQMQDLQNQLMQERIARQEGRIGELEEGLTPTSQRRLDLLREDIEAQKAPAIEQVREAGAETQEVIKAQMARRGFGRSSASAEQLRKAGDEVVRQVSAIEREANRQLSEYEISLLDKQDAERARLQERLEQTYDAQDEMKLNQIAMQQELTISLMKQDPSNPDNMIAAAEKLQTIQLQERELAIKEMQAMQDAAFKNFSYMVDTFGSDFVRNMDPQSKSNYAAAMGVSPQTFDQIGLTQTEQNRAWEQLKYQDTQQFELQKMVMGHEFDQNLAMQKFNQDLQILGIEQEFDLNKLAATQQFEVDLLNLKESLGKSKELEKWNALLGPLQGEYGKMSIGGDSSALTFGTPIPHPGGDIPVNSLNVALAKAFPDGFRFQAASKGDLTGQCLWFAEKLTQLGGKGWTIGNLIGDKKKNFEKYRAQGLGFKPGEEEIKVGYTVLTNESAKYGHGAVVNAITADGKLVLSESNFKSPLTVSNTRIIDPNSAKIFGILKTEAANRYKVPDKLIGILGKSIAKNTGLMKAGQALTMGITDRIKQMFGVTQQQDPSAQIQNNSFLSSVASGATKLSFSEEQEMAQVRPDIMSLYYQAKQMGQQTGGKQIPLSGAQDLAKYQGIEDMVNDLSSMVSQMEFDPVTKRFRGWNPWDPEAQQFNALKQSLTGPAARTILMEVGALTESDLARVDKLLPTFADTKETAQFKIDQLKQLVQRGRTNLLSAFGSAGYNVSQFQQPQFMQPMQQPMQQATYGRQDLDPLGIF